MEPYFPHSMSDDVFSLLLSFVMNNKDALSLLNVRLVHFYLSNGEQEPLVLVVGGLVALDPGMGCNQFILAGGCRASFRSCKCSPTECHYLLSSLALKVLGVNMGPSSSKDLQSDLGHRRWQRQQLCVIASVLAWTKTMFYKIGHPCQGQSCS